MIENNIKKEFKKYGLNYKQIKNDGIVYMFELSDGDGHKVGFDVFKADLVKADKYVDNDRYNVPSTYCWGTTAWSYGMYAQEKAEIKYNELLNAYKEVKNNKWIA